jgi:hypothetical protein
VTQKRSRRKAETCYLCGKAIAGDRSKDHFLARCLYEGRRAPNEPNVTLPAHVVCNRSTAKAEEWLAIALGLTTVSETHAPELTKRAGRALARDAGTGGPRLMSVAFLSQIVAYHGGLTLVPHQERVTWVLAKMVKGLLYREAGILLGSEVLWTIRQPDYADVIAPPTPPCWTVEIPSRGPEGPVCSSQRAWRSMACSFGS